MASAGQNVHILDSDGDIVSDFGGGSSSAGTEYTEGATDSTITGQAMLWEDTSDTLRAVSAAKPLPVGDAGGSLTVDNATISVVGGGVEATAQRVTIASDSTGVLSVDDNAGSLTVDGSVSLTPTTSGGTSIFRTLDADETEEAVKTSAGQIYGWFISNAVAAQVFVKIYNDTVANVTVGSTTPVLTIGIPASSSANVAFPNGIAFDTAITIAATTLVADNDATAPAANQVVANIFYK